MLSLGPSGNAAPPGFLNSSLQPLSARKDGSVALTVMFARAAPGFFRRMGILLNDSLSPVNPPPPATGATLRWPMLLSLGTSLHSGIESPGAMLLALLAS